MDAEIFETLAMRVLTGDATAREKAEFEQALAQNPLLREEFEELKAAREAFREFGPLAKTPEAAPAPLTTEQFQRLHQAVAQSQRSRRADGPRPRHSHASEPRRNFLPSLVSLPRERRRLAGMWAAAAAAILLAGGFLVTRFLPSATDTTPAAYLAGVPAGLEVRRAGQSLPVTSTTALLRGDRITVPAGAGAQFITAGGLVRKTGPAIFQARELITTSPPAKPSVAQTVLFQPLQAVLAATIPVTGRNGAGIALHTPRGATASLTPLILWKSAPGKTWDIAITDEFNRNTPPWRTTARTSPVEFTSVAAWKTRPLDTNGLYKITLRETGNSSPFAATEYTFTTLPTATSRPTATFAEAFLRAWQAANSDPLRLGDILAALAALPPELQDAEPALRLKLLAYGQLGLQDDYDAAATMLRTGVAR